MGSEIIRVELSLEKFEALLQLYLKLDSIALKKLSKFIELKKQIAKIVDNKIIRSSELSLTKIDEYNLATKELQEILNYCLPLILSSKVQIL